MARSQYLVPGEASELSCLYTRTQGSSAAALAPRRTSPARQCGNAQALLQSDQHGLDTSSGWHGHGRLGLDLSLASPLRGDSDQCLGDEWFRARPLLDNFSILGENGLHCPPAPQFFLPNRGRDAERVLIVRKDLFSNASGHQLIEMPKEQCATTEFRLPSKRIPSADFRATTCGFPHVDSMELLCKDEEQSANNKFIIKSRNTTQRTI
jgi:hypothetical protein